MYLLFPIFFFRFRQLEKNNPDQVRELSTLFRYHAASIEMERMEMMSQQNTTPHYRAWLSHHFDGQIHQVILPYNYNETFKGPVIST